MYKIYSKKLDKIVQSNKKMLVGYVLAGYKDNDDFMENVKLFEGSAVNILEIGFPSKNPYADGEVIANAHKVVDLDIATSLEYWKAIRKSTTKGIWLMAYNDDFIKTGIYKEFAREKVMDAIVIPDTDINSRLELQNELKEYNVDVIGFVNPLMNENELDFTLSNFPLVYEQLYIGQTGIPQTKEVYHEMLDYTKNFDKATAFAGFGINSYEKAKKMLDEGFDGAIIGTEMIKRINISKDNFRNFILELNKAVK